MTRRHDAPLGQGNSARCARACLHGGDDYALDNRLVRYDIHASIAHAEMLEVQGLLSAQDLRCHPRSA